MAISTKALRRWAWAHKWSSLVCTPFMLLLCVTGLPLIFHHEIGHLMGTEVEAPVLDTAAPKTDMDALVAAASQSHPDLFVQYLFQEPDEENLWIVGLNRDLAAVEGGKTVVVDAQTSEFTDSREPPWYMTGLFSGLVSDYPGDVWARIGLGVPAWVCIYYGLIRRNT